MKTAILYNGISHHHLFFTYDHGKYQKKFDEIIYFLDLPKIDLHQFDILIIPSRIEQNFLMENKKQLYDYLQSGKYLVCFGEMTKPWLPKVTWNYCPTNFNWWLKEGRELQLMAHDDEHEFFNYMSVNDTRWHYHGSFIPPVGATPIIINEHNESIIYEDTVSYHGTAIITSLDPDYHLGQRFIPKTEIFLDKFYEWIFDKWRKEHVT